MKSHVFYIGLMPYLKSALIGWFLIASPIILGCITHLGDKNFIFSKSFSLMVWFVILLLCLAVFVALLVALLKKDLFTISVEHDKLIIHRLHADSRAICKPYKNFRFTIKWNPILAFTLYSSIGSVLEKGRLDGDYEADPVTGSRIVKRHTTTMAQDEKWLRYAYGRVGKEDGYSVARHNCRKYSQWEFRDAPLHW